jgi:hypothetical protein
MSYPSRGSSRVLTGLFRRSAVGRPCRFSRGMFSRMAGRFGGEIERLDTSWCMTAARLLRFSIADGVVLALGNSRCNVFWNHFLRAPFLSAKQVGTSKKGGRTQRKVGADYYESSSLSECTSDTLCPTLPHHVHGVIMCECGCCMGLYPYLL